jgi:hypothetical protein
MNTYKKLKETYIEYHGIGYAGGGNNGRLHAISNVVNQGNHHVIDGGDHHGADDDHHHYHGFRGGYDDTDYNRYYRLPLSLNDYQYQPMFSSSFINNIYQKIYSYPINPSTQDIISMQNFINNIINIIPCQTDNCKTYAYNFIMNNQNNLNFICANQQNLYKFFYDFIYYMNPYAPEMKYVENNLPGV